jgi:hypothetical protein
MVVWIRLWYITIWCWCQPSNIPAPRSPLLPPPPSCSSPKQPTQTSLYTLLIAAVRPGQRGMQQVVRMAYLTR